MLEYVSMTLFSYIEYGMGIARVPPALTDFMTGRTVPGKFIFGYPIRSTRSSVKSGIAANAMIPPRATVRAAGADDPTHPRGS